MVRQRKGLRQLHRDEDGSVLIWSTLVIFVIIGLIGLGIDGARILNLNSNLQEIADAAAIAGAQKLDGSENAITNATNAAVNLLQANSTTPVSGNILKWSDVSASGYIIVNSGADAPKFFNSSGTATTDPKQASRIQVTTMVRNVSPTFSAISNITSLSTKATATAGVSYSVCAPLQSFICNPWEDDANNVKGASTSWLAKISTGQMIKLVNGTGGAPGNWGLIAPPNVNGNPWNQIPYWSQLRPSSCSVVSPSQVVNAVDTGNTADKAVTGMNVRFDNPDNRADSNVAAPIVIDGLAPNGKNNFSCQNDQNKMGGINIATTGANYPTYCNVASGAKPAVSCPFPRDRNMTNLGGNAWSTSLSGSGATDADLLAYWQNHHVPGAASIPDFYDKVQGKYVPTTTRWQIYQMENDTTTYPSAAFTADSEALEPSARTCDTSTPKPSITRRLINVAVVDCDYWGIKGGSNNLPVTTLMAEFFMTEPAEAATGAIFGELVRTYVVNGAGSNGAGSNLYRMVELIK